MQSPNHQEQWALQTGRQGMAGELNRASLVRLRDACARRRAWYKALFLTLAVLLADLLGTVSLGRFDWNTWTIQSSAILILCLVFLPMVFEAGKRVFDPLNPANFFLFVYAMEFGCYPLYLLSGGTRMPLLYLYSEFGGPSHYAAAQLLAVLGLTFYLLGYSSRVAWRVERALPTPRRLDLRRVNAVNLFLFAAGSAGAILLFRAAGGLGEFLANREMWRAGGMIGAGIYIMPVDLWLPLSGLLPMFAFTLPADSGFTVAKRFGFLVICLIPVFLLGFRTLFVMPFLQSLVILHCLRRPISIIRATWIGIFLVLLATIFGLSRSYDLDQMKAVGPRVALVPVFFRTPGTDLLSVVLDRAGARDFEYGVNSIAEAATIVIPHGLWPGKPLSWGEQFTTKYFADFMLMAGNFREIYGGVSPTSIGYFYLQCGWFGVALGMFAVGVACKAIYSYGVYNAGPNTGFMLYLLLWPLPTLLEAPQIVLNTLVITILFAWLPLSICLADRRHSPQPALIAPSV